MAEKIIVFDGECVLCSKAVQFVIRHDPHKKFKFAAIQSEAGKKMAAEYHLHNKLQGTFVLVSKENADVKSDAALKIVKELTGPVRMLYASIIIPGFIRNLFYDLISRNRYRWFGKNKSCMIPDQEIADRFIH